MLRDDADFARSVEHIPFNPLKHGYARTPFEWIDARRKKRRVTLR